MSFDQQQKKYLPAEEPGASTVYMDAQQQVEQPERAVQVQRQVAAAAGKLPQPAEEPGKSGNVVEVAPPEHATVVYYGAKEYRTWWKDVSYELPTGGTITYRYWYNPESGEWVAGHKVSGPETRWVYRNDERVGLEYKTTTVKGEETWIAAGKPPETIPVTESERAAFGEAWKTYYEQLEAERRAQVEEASAVSQLKALAGKLGIEQDTSLGVLQVRVIQAALERAGMEPGEAYKHAVKFQYADPREVLDFLKKAEVEYEGAKYTLLEWLEKGDKVRARQEHYLKQVGKALPPELPKYEDLVEAYREVWHIDASPATTFLESVSSGFTRTFTFGLLDVGGEVQRKVAAGLNRFLEIFASKVSVPEPAWRAIMHVVDPLGAQRIAAAFFGLDYEKVLKATAGAALKPDLKIEEKAELTAIASAIASHASAYVFGSAVGTGYAAAVQAALVEKALSAVPEQVKAKVAEKLAPKKVETRIEIPTEFELQAELRTRITKVETLQELEPGFSEWTKRYYAVKQELQYILTPTSWEKVPKELQPLFERASVTTQPTGVIPFRDVIIAGEKVPKLPEIIDLLKPSYVREWDALVAPGWFEKVPAERVIGVPRFTQFYDIYRGPAVSEKFAYQTWLEGPWRWRAVLYEPAKPMDLLIARGEGAGVDWAAYVRAVREFRTPDLPLGLEDIGKSELLRTERLTAKLTLDVERYLSMLRERATSSEVLYGAKGGGGPKTPLRFEPEASTEKPAPTPAAPTSAPPASAAKSSTPTPTSVVRLAEPR
ncbi:MAG: hypothetical protein QXR12_06750, partial [Thermofilum sp.]